MNVETGNTNLGTSGLLTNADILSVNVVDASVFLGTGHAGLDGATHAPLPRGADAIGFDVTGIPSRVPRADKSLRFGFQ